MTVPTETIAAIATAPGEAGIAIVRISGPESLAIADALFRGHGPKPSARGARACAYGTLASRAGGAERTVDEVVVLVMRAPHSYTREDVVELQCHGGALAARRILRAVLEAGARPAEPGEFTRRAFLNGRLDLLQAEAVLDLVRARSERAAQAAVEQLRGRLSDRFNGVYDALLGAAADLEASLDFPDDELPPTVMPDILARIGHARADLTELLRTWDEGHLLREGALVVISGRPNVGKSTLLNALLGMNRAIVTDVPGTTRDTIEEIMVLDGVPLRLVDTAGLRDTDCHIEREGVNRALKYVESADIHVRVVDGSLPMDQTERSQIAGLPAERCVIVLNKADLGTAVRPAEFAGRAAVTASLLNGEGLAAIREAIAARLHVSTAAPPHAVISERHRRAIMEAGAQIDEGVGLLETGDESNIVLAAAQVRAALETLGAVTGRVYHDELLNSVFSRFCVGK